MEKRTLLALVACCVLGMAACKGKDKPSCESVCQTDEKCQTVVNNDLGGTGTPDKGMCANFCTMLRTQFREARKEEEAAGRKFAPSHVCWPPDGK